MPYYKDRSVRISTIALDRIVATELNACTGNLFGTLLLHCSHLCFSGSFSVLLDIEYEQTDDGAGAYILSLLMRNYLA